MYKTWLVKMTNIPIIINNFNRLTTTKKLADDLFKLGYTDIHILDNNSGYQPLLDWYDKCPYTVVRLGKNLGQLAVYNSDYINKFTGWIAYSDSDIILGESTPKMFIDIMVEKVEKYEYPKIGLCLQIDDLPNNEYTREVKRIESKFWERKLEENLYIADVDTTFCLIKVGEPFCYKSLRIGGELVAQHHPWYLDYRNLSEEEKYILQESSNEYSTTKRFMDSHASI